MRTLAGLRPALRITWRRNWRFWLVWMVMLAMLMPATASQYDVIISPDVDPRLTIEPLRNNPLMLAILGPPFDLYDKGGFIFWRSGGFTTVLAGLMAGFGIIRSTRAEEEEGRVELVRSGPIGRHAPLAAAVIFALAACLLLGLLLGSALIGLGMAVPGSIAAGLAITATGAVFVGLGAVLAQVFETARAARGWTLGVGLGGMYLARAIVDGNGADSAVAWARWLIPLEWGMLTRPFAGERWWVFGLHLVFVVVMVLLAFNLESRRDHGAGLRPAALGPATAPASLGNTWGLAWRLQRGGLVGWTAALLGCAVAFGTIASQMDEVFEANPQFGEILKRMGGTAVLRDAFYIGILGILTVVTTLMAVGILNTLQGEEERGHAEIMLSTATSRTTFALSHLLWALLVPAVLFVGIGAALPLSEAIRQADPQLALQYAGTGAALIPGLVLVVGFAMVLHGWAPSATGLVWLVLGWSIFCAWFGVLLNLPDWVVQLQPWGHLAHPPRDEMDWVPFSVELLAGIVLLVLGFVGYRRRDIIGR